MSIDRCVCFNVKISKLKEIADQSDCKNIEDLQEYIDFGLACGMCLEYVEKMLDTGEVEFDWE